MSGYYGFDILHAGVANFDYIFNRLYIYIYIIIIIN
jgi:hypothetical protein